MRRFKGGHLGAFAVIVIALLMAVAFITIDHIQKRASLFSYDERVYLTIILDNTGSGLLSVLNSGETGLKHIEVLGSAAAGGHTSDNELAETPEGLKRDKHSLKVLVSEEEVKSYGAEPPDDAITVETDIPIPCTEDGDCKGRVRLGIW